MFIGTNVYNKSIKKCVEKINIKFKVPVIPEKREREWMREGYPGYYSALCLKRCAGYTTQVLILLFSRYFCLTEILRKNIEILLLVVNSCQFWHPLFCVFSHLLLPKPCLLIISIVLFIIHFLFSIFMLSWTVVIFSCQDFLPTHFLPFILN